MGSGLAIPSGSRLAAGRRLQLMDKLGNMANTLLIMIAIAIDAAVRVFSPGTRKRR